MSQHCEFNTTLDFGQFGEIEVTVVGQYTPEEASYYDADTCGMMPGEPWEFEVRSIKISGPSKQELAKLSPSQQAYHQRRAGIDFALLDLPQSTQEWLEQEAHSAMQGD